LETFSPHKARNVLAGLVAGSAEAQEVCTAREQRNRLLSTGSLVERVLGS
jgi:hypothetical protein